MRNRLLIATSPMTRFLNISNEDAGKPLERSYKGSCSERSCERENFLALQETVRMGFSSMSRSLRFLIGRLGISCLAALIGAVFLALPVNTSSMAIQQEVTLTPEAKLSSATVTFHTTDDDKEKDTAASLYIKLNDGTVVLKFENIKDYFRNGATSTYRLKVVKQVPKGSIQGCTGTVKTTRPKGHDAWKFYYEIEFVFSDGTRTRKRCSTATIGENDLKVCPL